MLNNLRHTRLVSEILHYSKIVKNNSAVDGLMKTALIMWKIYIDIYVDINGLAV